MTAIEEFACSLVELRAEDVPSAVRRKLELHVVDSIGAWIAASHTAEGVALIRFRERMRQPGDANAANLFADVATNCALARLSEIDDIHLASMTTPGSIVITGALTIARSLPQTDASD